MKQLFIFLLFSCSFLPISGEEHVDALLEAFTSPYIYNSVNVITGEYTELQTDLAHEDVVLRRYYGSNDPFAQGWQLNHTDKLIKTSNDDWVRYEYGGKSVVYTLEKAEPSRFGKQFLIKKVTSSEEPEVVYQYCDHPTERKKLICRRGLPEGRYQSIEYQDGKVKHLKGPVGLDESPVITHRFVYHEGYTEVFDALDHKTIYRFGDNQRLTIIEMYNQQGKLYRKELYDWDDQKRLVRKALEDGDGQLHMRHTFAYNDQGNVIQHTMHGNLTGNNSNECYSTYYHYSEDGNQLLNCTEDNGSRKRFLYDNERLVATFTLDKDSIKIREFYTYNQDGDLIQTILDDGNSEDSDDLSTCTERHITNIIGDAVEEKYWDFSDNREVLLKRTVNTYSDTHKLIQRDIFDADGVYRHSLYRNYDEQGRLITEIDPQGKTTYTSYDANGNILSLTSDEKQSAYLYDFSNRLIRMKKNEKECKIVESHRYDAGGNRISTIDIFGNETHFEYDAFGRAIKSIYPDGSSTSCEYDIFDRMTKIVDPKGYATITRYNIRGKPIEIIYPDNTTEKYEYNLDGSLRKHIAKNGTYTIYDRDYLSRVVEQEWYNSEGKLERTFSSTYNTFHLISTSDYTTYTYDGAGRKSKKTRNNRTVKFEYDALGHLHLQKEEEAYIHFEYDAKDNLKEIRMYDASGNIIKKETMEEKPEPHRVYHYDDVLQIIMTNEHGIITETTFDKMSRIETIVKKNPFGTVISKREMRYDPSGNKIREINYLNADETVTTAWEYGPNNRIEKIIDASGTTHYTYDTEGRLSGITKPNGIVLQYAYNASGRTARLWSSDNTVDYQYTYDSNGHIIHIDDAINKMTTQRLYSPEGHCIQEVLGNGLQIGNSYDKMGRRKTLTLPDDSMIEYQYDAAYLREIHRYSQTREKLYSHFYTEYNLHGKLVSSQMVDYKRNEKQQITAVNSPYWSEIVDETGVTIHDPGGKTSISYTYDDNDQLVGESGDFENSYEYDWMGNRLNSKENEIQYIYDALDRLIQVTVKDMQIYYVYDAFHRRLSKTVNDETIRYVYDGNNEIGAVDPDGNITQLRVLGIGHGAEIGAAVAIELNQDIYLPIHDHRGSVRCLIDTQTQLPVEYYRYSAFGKVIIFDANSQQVEHSIVNNPWRFSSKRIDHETGLIYFGKRYYAPSLGRWIKKDPLGFPDGPNPYVFCKNNPMKYHDLYGLFSFNDLCDQFISYAVKINQCLNNTIATLQHHLSFSNYIYPKITRLGEKIFGRSLLSFAGFYQDQSEIGVHGTGELIDNVRITMINGILTSRYDYKRSLEKLSETHGGMNIHYVFHATEGWTMDFLKSTLIKFGYFSPHTYQLAETWKALIEEMGGPEGGGTIIHYAHSIGAVDTHHAKTLLTPEEQKMIHVITIGSATMLEDNGFGSVINYTSKRDGVSYLDPIGFIKGLLGSDETIMVGSWLGFPLIDHPLLMDTYTELIEKLGEQFVRRYGL